MISVIVPVYNAEKTLRQCVDSVLSQEFKDFELLLIDDGSKDQSLAICDEYAIKDSRVRAFHKENAGVSSARNLGLDHCKGEWITFIDSDDYITQGYFDGVLEHDEDVLIKGYQKFNHSGVVSERKTEELLRLSNFTDFLNQYVTDTLMRGAVFKFYRRSIISDLRFLTDMKIGEDVWFVFKYLAKCKSFAVISLGNYMVRLAEKPEEVKYAITVNYAAQSLNHLKDAFDGLAQAHCIRRGLFLHYIGYFKRISKGDWRLNRLKWYGNTDIKALYDYVWPALSINQKFRLTIAGLLRK